MSDVYAWRAIEYWAMRGAPTKDARGALKLRHSSAAGLHQPGSSSKRGALQGFDHQLCAAVSNTMLHADGIRCADAQLKKEVLDAEACADLYLLEQGRAPSELGQAAVGAGAYSDNSEAALLSTELLSPGEGFSDHLAVHYVFGLFGNNSSAGISPAARLMQKQTVLVLVQSKLTPYVTVHGRDSVFRSVLRYIDSGVSRLTPMELRSARQLFMMNEDTLRPVTRGDIGRFAILHEHGGLYLDVDAQLLARGATHVGKAHCANEALVFGDRIVKPSLLGPREDKRNTLRIGMHALYSPAHGRLAGAVLDEQLRRLILLEDEQKGAGAIMSDSDVLWASGPDAVTSVVGDHLRKVATKGPGHSGQSLKIAQLNSPEQLDAGLVAHREEGSWRTGAIFGRRKMPVTTTRSRGIVMALGRVSDVAMGIASLEGIRHDHSCAPSLLLMCA